MKITWLGHSCFLIETAIGTRLIIDPYLSGSYNGDVAYGPVAEAADAVLVTHQHPDHNAVQSVLGDPRILIEPETANVGNVEVRGVPVFHDERRGKDRGTNTIIVMRTEGLNVVHLGDLGHELDDQTVEAIGPVDVALVPVGGYFTIDAEGAARVVDKLAPKIAIPMHFKTDSIAFSIAPVDDFIADKPHVQRPGSSTLELSRESLPAETTIVLLEHAR
jgi:L-ascorbate metabolism protein UlaG (beta-lactamase superfamily)